MMHAKAKGLSRSPVSAGFTLVEVMVSLVIASFVVAVLFSATRAVGKRWSGNAQFNQQTIARNAAFDFLRRQLAQLAPLRYQPNTRVDRRRRNSPTAVFSGSQHELRFAATIPRHRAYGGLFLVAFSLQADPDGAAAEPSDAAFNGLTATTQPQQLLFSYQRLTPAGAKSMALTDEAEQKVLLTGVAKVEFTYLARAATGVDSAGTADAGYSAFAGKVGNGPPEWQPEWQSHPQFPALVKMRVSFVSQRPGGDVELILPIQAEGRVGRVALDIRDLDDASGEAGQRFTDQPSGLSFEAEADD